MNKLQQPKIINGHKNNHFLSSNKNGLNKILNSKQQIITTNDLNKKYLTDDFENDDSTLIEKDLKSITTTTTTNIDQKSKTKKLKLQKNSKAKENLRTTLMLTIVCSLFIITEFPQSIVLFLSILSTDFYHNVYMPLGDLMDIFALTNNSINFLLYCTMSRAFRNTFYSIISKLCFLNIDIKQEKLSFKSSKNQKQLLNFNQTTAVNSSQVVLTPRESIPVELSNRKQLLNTKMEDKRQSFSNIELKPFLMQNNM